MAYAVSMLRVSKFNFVEGFAVLWLTPFLGLTSLRAMPFTFLGFLLRRAATVLFLFLV